MGLGSVAQLPPGWSSPPRHLSVQSEGPSPCDLATACQCPDQDCGSGSANYLNRHLVEPALRAVAGAKRPKPREHCSEGFGGVFSRLCPPGSKRLQEAPPHSHKAHGCSLLLSVNSVHKRGTWTQRRQYVRRLHCLSAGSAEKSMWPRGDFLRRIRLPAPNPLPSPHPTPAPIPSAVDPHTVERAWSLASRWSAPLYERPGRQGPRLLGFAWVDGRRDGSSPRTPLLRPALASGAPAISEPERPRRRHALSVARAPRFSTHDPACFTCGRASAQPAGAGRRQERRRSGAGKRARRSGAQPGLDEVEKPVTASLSPGQAEGAPVVRSRLVNPAWQRRSYASSTSAGRGWLIMKPCSG
ncbi:hypothetical protein QFZ55_005959 [Streptomyces luteogriseus]|nr:hypothetical protein [Streptomyces luteogriseus]